jgi:tetratricopeptide (TPR) repeat protein
VISSVLKYVLSFIIASALLFPADLLAQVPVKADPDEALKLFTQKNYRDALKIYLALCKKDSRNTDYNYHAGLCYLFSASIKAKAVPHLEYVVKQPAFEFDAWFYLGKAYHFALRFDDAVNAYNKYKTFKPKNIGEVEMLIEQCFNGKELIKRPVNVSFENLGKEVNSEFPDYFPFATADDNNVYFTSRRKTPSAQQVEFDGLYPSDMMVCTKKPDGKWAKAAPLPQIVNTNLDEEVVYISPDGTTLLYYIDHIQEFGDIHQTNKLNAKGQFLQPQKLDEKKINSDLETSAFIWKSADGETEILYFSSSRSGNTGMTDIYTCKKLPGGFGWGQPVQLSTNINTKYKEEFPWVSADGKTLYFTSQGHSSIGGFDIFKSVWDEDANDWSKPKNLGYPINTAEDNMTISFISERVAYVSAFREEGLGDLDIYKMTFDDIDGKEVIYRGFVLAGDSIDKKIKDAQIHVENKKTKELYGTFVPDKNKGYYIMALPPGKWTVNIEAEGYTIYIEDIIVFDYVGFKPDIIKDFKLKK